MADVPVGAVPAPATPAAPAAARAPDPSVARAAKLASVSAGLAATLKPDSPAPAEPAASTGAAPTGKTAEPAPAPVVEAPAADKKPPVVAAKPADKDDKAEPVDDKTAKAIAAIDRRAAAFRQEQSAATAKLELDRAELAKLRADVDGRGTSDKELRELAKRDPVAALAKLGIDTEDDWEVVGRGAYARTKAGKADPRAQPAVAQTARERQVDGEIAELRQQNKELVDHLRTQSAQQQSAKFVGEYLDSAVKAIPATPSLIGRLHAKSPEKARQALLATGKAMEREAMAAEGTKKYDPSHTPSHDELIARYEKNRRAELEEHGVDVDALLAPAAPAKPAPVAAKASATIDPNAVRGTRPVNENPTREERLAAVSAGLKKLDAAQN